MLNRTLAEDLARLRAAFKRAGKRSCIDVPEDVGVTEIVND
jgi:hypothetical protein